DSKRRALVGIRSLSGTKFDKSQATDALEEAYRSNPDASLKPELAEVIAILSENDSLAELFALQLLTFKEPAVQLATLKGFKFRIGRDTVQEIPITEPLIDALTIALNNENGEVVKAAFDTLKFAVHFGRSSRPTLQANCEAAKNNRNL